MYNHSPGKVQCMYKTHPFSCDTFPFDWAPSAVWAFSFITGIDPFTDSLFKVYSFIFVLVSNPSMFLFSKSNTRISLVKIHGKHIFLYILQVLLSSWIFRNKSHPDSDRRAVLYVDRRKWHQNINTSELNCAWINYFEVNCFSGIKNLPLSTLYKLLNQQIQYEQGSM